MGKKNNQKLREELKQLFKARGVLTTNKKQETHEKTTKQNSKLNNDIKKANKNVEIEKGSNGIYSISKNQHLKPKTINNETNEATNKKSIHANGHIPKPNSTETTAKDPKKREKLEKSPAGYFVMNHDAVKSNNKHEKKSPKQKKEKLKTKQGNLNQEVKINLQKSENSSTQSSKRKDNRDNGPKNKKPKLTTKLEKELNISDEKDELKSKDLKTKQSLKTKTKTSNVSNKKEVTKSTDAAESSMLAYGNSKFNSLNEYDGSSDEMLYNDYTDESDTTEEYSEEDSYDSECSDKYSLESDDYEEYYDEDDNDDTYSDSTEEEYEPSFDSDNEWNDFHDPDYKFPQHELEDLIIHKGLAIKHNLSAKYEVEFDESIEEAQIVELPKNLPINSVKQHQSYDIEHLRKLETQFLEKVTKKSFQSKTIHASFTDEECPELVPIDDINFRLWTSGITMDDEIFSDCDEYTDYSEESITVAEGNINKKYLQANDADSYEEETDEDSDDNDNERNDDLNKNEKQQKTFNIRADVILANQADMPKLQFKNDKSTQAIQTEQGLTEIIAQSQNLMDLSKVVIKGVEVMALENENIAAPPTQNFVFDELETLRDCVKNTADQPKSTNVLDYNSDVELAEIAMDISQEDSGSEAVPIKVNETSKQINQTQQMPQFNTQFFNSLDSHQVLVLLKNPFYIYGTVKATLIAGYAEIYGFKLKKWETQELYSPRGCCALQICPISNSVTTSKSNLEQEILATIGTFSDECEFQLNDLERLLAAFTPGTDAILLLARNEAAENTKRMLQQHVNENIFPAQIPLSRPHYTTEYLLDCMINTIAEYPLHIPEDWFKLRLESNSKFLFVGGKSVGKSTLLRYLVNEHLNSFPSILLIDLDIGQPEIFASQAVSCALVEQPLLGPGFFYDIKPDKAFIVAHFNIQLCAHQYMLAVIELLKYCYAEPKFRDIPWIVNTMGYNKGFGAELISVICEHLRPTDVVQLQSNLAINNFDFIFEPAVLSMIKRNIYYSQEYAAENIQEPMHRLHVLSSAILQQSRYQREWQMSAKDMRYIMLLTHLARILNENGEILNQINTFCRDLDQFHVINLIPKQISSKETLKSANANLVYLCCDESSADADLKVETIKCVGIGIVRGVDFHAGKIYILTALPLKRLMSVNCLALSEMPLPASILTLQNTITDSNIPFVQNVADEATSRAIRQFYYRT